MFNVVTTWVKETENANKNRKRMQKCGSILLISLISSLWRSAPGCETPKIILFVFYSWPARHPDLPSYCFAPSQTQPPPFLSFLCILLILSFPILSPICVISLSSRIHDWLLIYIKYMVQGWEPSCPESSRFYPFFMILITGNYSLMETTSICVYLCRYSYSMWSKQSAYVIICDGQ